ncbi:S-adenosyl-L-methionine-dependent methyltransferase [Aspergillus piperis CBS 112811]|uniref:S-adenosyl-L-methionine-dependent methyltransferase n=1 Tax=Aspergillus piperis CBS 112811 TaxID=1448313 RepID=A0A8G1RE20_9EURO|nr:S-adenosyl-L-methionine-dependent methyltransferase [Aspergillus piperis CBS 112811]RAH63526.1 S-adenosyl-L-methionine-dependent methyltransferase [Aspergillus piperis CBS 112811]
MEQLRLQAVCFLLEEVKTSIEELQDKNTDKARVAAHGNVIKLARAIENPNDLILNLFFSPTQLMAVKVGHDVGLFAALVGSNTAVTSKQLAAASDAHPLLIERIMRVLVAMGFAEEQEGGTYLANALSREMTEKASTSVIETLFTDVAPVIQKTPEFLRKSGYQNPENGREGPFQYTYNTSLCTFDWLAENPIIQARFHAYVDGVRSNRPYWFDWFPVQERMLNDCAKNPDEPLLVDIGGGTGRDISAFRDRFPDAIGRLFLEDLPSVIDRIQSVDQVIEPIKYNIYDPQPVHGARVYYLKFLLHEFDDENCKVALRNITAAMKRGYSKLVIDEFVLPDQNAGIFYSMLDMGLMAFRSGMVRTQTQWTTILQSVGLHVNVICFPDGNGPAIIEAELLGEDLS